jgi:hypothetical protein
VLDDIERRALLVEPAGEDAPPAFVELLDIDLHERPGELIRFPWRGLVAGAQADDDIADTGGLPRLELELACNPVALVEQAEHRLALVHRGGRGVEHAGVGADGHDFRAARGIALPGGDHEIVGGVVARFPAAFARAEPEQQHRCRRCGATPHASGVQAS